MNSPLDVEQVRKDFPILERRVHGDRPLVYLDSAATSQKPRVVLEALDDYYALHNANVHRGIHVLAEEATALYEGARDKVAAFVGAPSRDEVVFTKNSTEALNLVANVLAWAPAPYRVGPGDEIVITEMEHHSNIVPWQLLAERTGATLRWFGITDEGRLDLSDLDDLITERTKVVSFVYVSNILGTVNPVTQITQRAREVGALSVVDASQAVPQLPVDVAALGADFVAFTGHKMCGPTGVGVLWGRRELLDALPPFLGGGEMIADVRMSGSTYAALP
ncbi:MAG TPA: aminotransferase class V-fold PLP-dependent enzyme, partial [Actinomycetes bacterium]|nr:aminotransferase class V-fold PLP-dependent enzyme [Actinomycetes bacterium]